MPELTDNEFLVKAIIETGHGKYYWTLDFLSEAVKRGLIREEGARRIWLETQGNTSQARSDFDEKIATRHDE